MAQIGSGPETFRSFGPTKPPRSPAKWRSALSHKRGVEKGVLLGIVLSLSTEHSPAVGTAQLQWTYKRLYKTL